MLKVTIQLPNGTTITLEATEPQTSQDIIASVKEYLSLDSGSGSNGRAPEMSLETPVPSPSNGATPKRATPKDPPKLDTPTDPRFLKFCQKLTPMGDMRRVVVVTEGARRFLGMDQVSSPELATLFDAVQWPKPKDFILTLRNAGRSKFRWLQRVPGNSGYYTVTDRGRQEILSQGTESV